MFTEVATYVNYRNTLRQHAAYDGAGHIQFLFPADAPPHHSDAMHQMSPQIQQPRPLERNQWLYCSQAGVVKLQNQPPAPL
jgi:hypothetical protein